LLRKGHFKSLGWFAEPLADDGDGFVRVALGELADAMDGLGVDLALHLRDVDQVRGVVVGCDEAGGSARRGRSNQARPPSGCVRSR